MINQEEEYDDEDQDDLDADENEEKEEEELDTETASLLSEFRQASKEASLLIEEQLAKASEALTEACEIAEKFSIPFRSNIYWVGNNYMPADFHDKFSSLEGQEEFDEMREEFASEYGNDQGWEHSDFCY
jgi:hypothetical protein